MKNKAPFDVSRLPFQVGDVVEVVVKPPEDKSEMMNDEDIKAMLRIASIFGEDKVQQIKDRMNTPVVMVTSIACIIFQDPSEAIYLLVAPDGGYRRTKEDEMNLVRRAK